MQQRQILWQARRGKAVAACVLVRTCAGVDLEVALDESPPSRERYADTGTACERAHLLLQQYTAAGFRALEIRRD